MHGISRIDHNIQKDLFQLAGVPPHGRKGGIKLLDDLDIVKGNLIFQKKEPIGYGPIDIGEFKLWTALTGKFKEALYYILTPCRLMNDLFKVLPRGLLISWATPAAISPRDRNFSS